ncbi:Mannose-binding lectin [Phytophthora cinnamomi]|uniref:Mannose-binding lectin n=1 Tax=Phytophthora cinnamomi TaxID=4785 RepID=UPI003559FDA5|nr:Mannose-binding lectin [Phytophthora cinnamomi]
MASTGRTSSDADGKPKAAQSAHPDEPLPLLAADARDSLHGALLEDKTPEILFHEDAIGDTDSEHEDDDAVSTDGSLVLDDEARLVMCRSTGRVGSKERWGHEPLAVDLKLLSVGVAITDGVVVKVEGFYLPDEGEEDGLELFELQEDELITKVHLFRVRREIHAIQFVTNHRTSERFGGTKHGELCKAVEAPEGSYIASFFGDVAKDEADIDLGVRFADRPKSDDDEPVHVEVAEIDQVK